jgi:hypothetical protein
VAPLRGCGEEWLRGGGGGLLVAAGVHDERLTKRAGERRF